MSIMKIYNDRQELLAEDKETLVNIIEYLNCTLEIPEIKVLLKDQSLKNKMKKCQCCSTFCCLKVPNLG